MYIVYDDACYVLYVMYTRQSKYLHMHSITELLNSVCWAHSQCVLINVRHYFTAVLF